MSNSSSPRWPVVLLASIMVVFVAAVAVVAFVPAVRNRAMAWASSVGMLKPATSEDDGHDHAAGDPHAGHSHDHPGHVEELAIALSSEAERTIGLKLIQVDLQTFARSLTIPAQVVERAGKSTIDVTAPLTGIVTRIHIATGETVEPGKLLFELRLTHEELVQTQAELLRSLGERDVVRQEIKRLTSLTDRDLIAGKTLLAQEQQEHKITAAIEAQQQALLLHGLSEEQVETIVGQRKLLRALSVKVPIATDEEAADSKPLLQVKELLVKPGQHVTAGDPLCQLTDYRQLLIEGLAFEQDLRNIERATAGGSEVTAIFEHQGSEDEIVRDLKILYVANHVESQARTFHFYVPLPNEPAADREAASGKHYISWRFKPGQRLKLRVATEVWNDKIVLPATAVVQEGSESYVFKRFGDHFDRQSVKVDFRDPYNVVLPPGGGLKVGDIIAASAAEQLHIALKNKSSGGIDPHAGHMH